MAESVPQCGKSLGVTFQWRIKKCAFASSEQLKVITLRQSVSSIKLRPSLTLLFPSLIQLCLIMDTISIFPFFTKGRGKSG